jgi:hypothetical protein
VGRNLSTGRPRFEDPFGRPVLYYKARLDSQWPDISVDKDHFILSTRYIYLVNFHQWEHGGTGGAQRGADEPAYGEGKMTREVALRHWMAKLAHSQDAEGFRYPYNPKTYVLWMAGADERFGYWYWSEEHSGFVCDVLPGNAADGVGICNDLVSWGN